MLRFLSVLVVGVSAVATIAAIRFMSVESLRHTSPSQRGLASVANSSASESTTGVNSAKSTFSSLTSEQSEQLNQAVIRYFLKRARSVTNKKEFEKEYLSGLAPRDRLEFSKELKGDFSPVRVRYDGQTLFFPGGGGGYELKVQWPKITEPRFIVNGIEWTINPRQPFMRQLGLLIKKLEYAEQRKNSKAMTALLPNANAQIVGIIAKNSVSILNAAKGFGKWASITIAGGLFTGFAFGLGPDFMCWAEYDRLKYVIRSCSDWKKQIEEAKKQEREQKGATLQVVEQARTAAAEDSTEWLGSREQQCPSREDKTSNVYVADLLELRVAKGKVAPKGNWFSVRLEVTPDGKAKDGFTAPQGTDMDGPDAITKATNIMKFDEKGVLKEIQIPNLAPKVAGDPGWKRTVPIDLSLEDTKLEPEQRARRDQIKSLVKSLNDWIGICMRKDQVKKYLENRGQTRAQGGTGAAQQPVSPNGTSEPSPAIRPTGPTRPALN